MSGLYAKSLEMLCDPFLGKPESIPRSWADMTPSEQAMTVWFARKHFGAKELEAVARHAVACHSKASGGYDLDTANGIFAMFYKDEH
jgi:hypothetical protein